MPKHVGSILIFCFIFFAATHASEADETWPEVDYTAAAEPEEEGLDFTRIKLTGDWGGGRTDMAKKGITFDIDISIAGRGFSAVGGIRAGNMAAPLITGSGWTLKKWDSGKVRL